MRRLLWNITCCSCNFTGFLLLFIYFCGMFIKAIFYFRCSWSSYLFFYFPFLQYSCWMRDLKLFLLVTKTQKKKLRFLFQSWIALLMKCRDGLKAISMFWTSNGTVCQSDILEVLFFSLC